MFKQKLFQAALFLGAAFIMIFVVQPGAIGKAPGATLQTGQWTFQSNTDSTGAFYSTNGACIQAGGTWYATTSGAGSGHWYQKGNNVHLHGNYVGSPAGGGVNDSFELVLSGPNAMDGFLQEWHDSGSYSGYYQSKWKFISKKCDPASK